MKRITLPVIALGILVSAGPTYADTTFADNAETIKAIKDLIEDVNSISSVYTAPKGLWDVGVKVAEFLQLIKPEPTNADIMKKLNDIQDDINAAYTGDNKTDHMAYISLQLATFENAFLYLEDGIKLVDRDANGNEVVGSYFYTRQAAQALFSNDDLFRRPKNAKDDTLRDRFNQCGGCVYTLADLDYDPSTKKIYDWRLALPSLMLAVGWRIQIIATVHPDFFLNPNNEKGVKDELTGYRDKLYKHYVKMVNGIRCANIYDECADIYSSSKMIIPPGPERWWWHAVYGALPLHEVKALIDTLNRYIEGTAQADLAQNYHRLPGPLLGNVDPWCLHVNSDLFSSFDLRACDGSSTQEWIYDRVTGSVMNFGTLANPATGGCLGVAGGTHPNGARRSQLNLILTQCADPTKPYQALAHRHQQWTYDPQSKVLLNAMGTALSFHYKNGGYSAGTEPYQYLMADNMAYEFSFGDSSTVQWQADQPIPGIPTFSDTMEPGETMHKGESRVSPNNQYELILQTDGNLKLYEKKLDKFPFERAVRQWASGTNGKNVDRVVLEGSGNLAIYPSSIKCRISLSACSPPAPIWQSNTQGHPSSHLKVQDDGRLVIYDQQSKEIWPAYVVCVGCDRP